MSENRLQRLADDLAAELDEYQQLKTEITKAQTRIGTHEPDSFELRAIGSILHDVYSGAEGICQHIAKEIDRQVPVGPNWHRDLLDQMTQPLPKTRPVVVQSETATLLEKYRAFRHIFRNIYGPKLEWTQMKPLLDNAVSAIDVFANDIEQFIAFLRLMTTSRQGDT
jgi:hypothetical protein